MAPLPNLAAHARGLLTSARAAASDLATRSPSNVPASTAATLSQLGPLAARSILLARDDSNTNADGTPKVDPHKGVVAPQDINNTFVFVLFGLIGAAFVCAAIWFFFWAKNGGFYFKEDDWDDYKSTVLRRKGPNGTILSNATPSTNLGGGSIYKDVPDNATEYTGGLTQMTGDTGSTLTGITAGASDIAARERRKQKRERKEREREKKRERQRNEKTGRRVGEDGVLVDEDAEAAAKDHLRAYRHEKAARVGGINKESEGSQWDGSTNPENSTVASDLLSHRQTTPTNTPTKSEIYSDVTGTTNQTDRERERERERSSRKSRAAGGIRKVYSTADRTADRENEQLRAEARRLQGKEGRSGDSRVQRNFSFQRATAGPSASAVSSSVRASTIEEEPASAVDDNGDGGRYLPAPGGWVGSEAGGAAVADSDLGTKSYHHVIPGLSSSASASGSGSASNAGTTTTDYAEEKRKKRASQRHHRRSER
ncbi:hypothetical protein AAE478_004781 [Parahypoxylon ruwenzoriense]